MTLAPSLAKVSAQARPIPLLDAVTSASLPLRPRSTPQTRGEKPIKPAAACRPERMSTRAERAAAASIAVSVAIVAVKVFVQLVTGSVMVAAEVVDSLGDVVTSSVSLLALRLSRRPPDADHPYGHAKYDSLLGFLASTLLFEAEAYVLFRSARCLIAGYAAPRAPTVALWALVGTSVVNMFRSAALWAVGRGEESRVLQSEALNYGWDAGRTLVVAGVLLISSRVAPWLDPASAVVVSLAIMPSTLRVAYWSATDLLDRVDPGLVESIRDVLSSTPGVRWVERVRARRAGRLVLVDAVVGVDPELTTEQASQVMMEAHRAVERVVGGPCDVTLAVRPAGESLWARAARIAESQAGVVSAHSIELYGPGRDRLTLHLVIDGNLRLGEADEIARRVEERIARELSLRQVVAQIDHLVRKPRPDLDLEAVRRAVESVPSVRWAKVRDVRCADGRFRLEVTVGADPSMSLAEANRLAHEVQAALAEVAPDAVAVVRVTAIDQGSDRREGGSAAR